MRIRVLLTLASCGALSGCGIATEQYDARVSQGDGPKVTGLMEGLAALKGGAKALDYDGASGPCTFDAIGDIQDVKFRFDRVTGGKLVLLSIG